MKAYANARKMSLSELVESYFEKVTRPVQRISIVDLVENMKVPAIPKGRDLRNEYFNDIEKKYGK